jgi:hypothetical protein
MRFMHWFDTSECSKFAEQIATDYDKLRRSVAVRGDDAAKQARKFNKLEQRVEEFHRERRLNFYQKAKMLSEIKAGMALHGIEQEEISAFLRSLLLKGLPR